MWLCKQDCFIKTNIKDIKKNSHETTIDTTFINTNTTKIFVSQYLLFY